MFTLQLAWFVKIERKQFCFFFKNSVLFLMLLLTFYCYFVVNVIVIAAAFECKPNQAIRGSVEKKKKTRLYYKKPGGQRVTVSLKTSSGKVGLFCGNLKKAKSS